MAEKGHPAVGSIDWAVALALLQFGTDTRAARALKDLRAGPSPDLMTRLADELRMPPAERRVGIALAHERAADAAGRAAATGLSVLPWFDAAYPALLREIPDPPIVLWFAGNLEVLALPAVAIVGSRRASPAGLAIARRLGRDLAAAGLTIVSGLARGIDAAAHQGALDADGRTIGVLGCGGDIVYPPEHAALSARMVTSGGVLTEFPPGMPPLAHHFPLRNRIISGLCRAVVVVEASLRSGSLITARLALEQGRDVLAVPGNAASGQYAGGHALIKDGAPLVETVEDVFNELGWRPRGRTALVNHDNSPGLSELETTMAKGEPYTVEELAARTGLETARLLAELGVLEVAGRITRVSGAGFVRT